MKKISLIIFLIILNFGCEKVVEIDLDFNEKRYVIDAKINKHVNSDKAKTPLSNCPSELSLSGQLTRLSSRDS